MPRTKKDAPQGKPGTPQANGYTLAEQFRRARNAGCPLIGIDTADPAATVATCRRALNGKDEQTPVCSWDILNGLRGLSAAGRAYAAEVAPDGAIQTSNPAECLSLLAKTPPEKGIVFVSNAHLILTQGNEPNLSTIQGTWNLRDIFKASGSQLVLLAPALRLPPELARDVVSLSEPLPTAAEHSKTVDSVCKDATLPAPDDETRPAVLDTLLGLSAFEAEQAIALSLRKDGIDQADLWSRKVKAIEQTPGLQVWSGGETFDDLGGLENLKDFLRRVLTSGKTPVRTILYIDEAEKSLAGAAGDTSGTSQDQLGVLLQTMQDKNLPGIILVGPAGTGKSSIAKAAGNVAGAPVIACDLGAMKGSLVGQSEARIRTAMNVFQAVSAGKGLAIATCNKLTALPPELKRRFALGTFYIDLPTAEEQAAIWPIWLKRYELDESQERPPCRDWTGSEIRACCDVAYRTGMTLLQAAAFVVPVSKSAADQIDQLRKLAHGKFISASYPGTYDADRAKAA